MLQELLVKPSLKRTIVQQINNLTCIDKANLHHKQKNLNTVT